MENCSLVERLMCTKIKQTAKDLFLERYLTMYRSNTALVVRSLFTNLVLDLVPPALKRYVCILYTVYIYKKM